MLYLAALVAAATLLTIGWTEAALLAGIAATAAYGLSERLLPGLVELERSAAAGDRLAQPLTYWNGQGALAAIGLVLAAGLIAARATRRRGGRARRDAPRLAASRRRRPRAASPPPAARRRGARCRARAVPLLGLDLYLTLSRGALGALVAGLLVLVALVPTRAALLAALLLAVGAAAPRRARGDRPRRRHARRCRGRRGRGDARRRSSLAGAACALAAARHRRRGGAIARLRPLRRDRARRGARGHGRVRPLRHADDRLRAARVRPEQPLRLLARGRRARSPTTRCAGIGTGSFRVEWLLRRDRDESVRDAHSLYLETAAELGLVGPRRARARSSAG